MRLALAIAVTAALVLPGAAAAGPAQCRNLDSQIVHYQGMVERSKELDNEMWEERTQMHVVRLMERRREAGCPEPVKDAGMSKAFKQLFRLAAKAAITYFTFGAF